jgi:hypothetical protein
MVRRRHEFWLWFFLLSFLLVFGSSVVESKDFIQWKGIVWDVQAPEAGGPPQGGGGPGGGIPEPSLPGASISLVSNPSVATTSGGTDGCSIYPSDPAYTADCGRFTLSGIPANQLHWIKVTKTGHLPTNIGIQFGNQDVDSSNCYDGSTSPCTFDEELFSISEEMVQGVSQRVPALTIDPTKAIVVVEVEGDNDNDLGIYDFMNLQYLKTVTIYLNGSDIPLTPQQYVDIEPGRVWIIPNVPAGTATVRVEITGLNIPVISLPTFPGEATHRAIVVIDTANTGVISGTVTSGGSPVEGVTVNAMPNWGRPVTALTASDGTYSLRVRANTQYRIEARKEGYASQFYFQTDRWDWATLTSLAPEATQSGVDFTLEAARKVTGKVTAGGNPVPNTWVNAFSQSTQSQGGGSTDASGNYTMWLKPGNDYKVQVNPQGYASQYWNNKSGFMQADLLDVSSAPMACEAQNRSDCVDFALTAGKSISGTVTLANGSPLANAWVNAWSESSGAGGGGNTNQAGQYTMTVAPAADYRVSVNMPNYPQAFYAGQQSTSQWNQAVLVDVTQNNATGVNIQVSAGKSISGTVKDGQGTGIANIQVNAFSNNGGGNGTTNQNGVFTINVPPGPGFRVEAFSQEYPRVMWKGTISNGEGTNDATTTKWEEATEIDTSNQDITGIDITLAAGITISGRVESNGSGVQGAWVNAWSDSDQAWGGGNTDGQGNFSFKVPAARGYKINANHPDYPMVFYKTTDVASCATDCAPDQTTQRWDEAAIFDFAAGGTSVDLSSTGAKGVLITFASGGSISGTVTANGKPVAGLFVNAFSEQGFGAGEPTNAQGQYRIKVPVGTYRVEIWSQQYVHQFYNGKYDWSQADLVEVSDGENGTLNVIGINFNLSTGNSISGRVTFNGSGVPNIWVNAQSESTTSGNGASTDAQGYYRMNLRPAPDYRVGVWHPDYVPQMYNGKTDWMQADRVDVSAGSATNINFALSQGVEISGTVLANGNPPEADQWGNRGWVNAFSQKTGSGAGASIQADGTYRLKVNPASDYRVEVWHPNYARQFYNGTAKWDEATLLDTTSGSRSGIDFSLSSGRTITGTITDENDNPKAGVWVNAWSETTWSGGGEKTANDGTYTIRGLAAGVGYRVSIWSNDPGQNYANVFYKEGEAAGTFDYMQATQLDLTNGNAPGIDIKLSAGKSISGTVSVASGTLSGNIWIDAFSNTLMVGRGEPVRYNTGDTSATYTIKGLPAANDYRVHIWADNFGNLFYNNTPDWNAATLVDVSGGDATNKDFTLSTGASISGTIYHTSANAANLVRNGWVQAMNPTAGSYQGAPIQSDGTYRINGLTAGTSYTVQASSSEYMPMFYNGETSSAAWVEPNVIATEAGTTDVNIILSAGYTISGRVFASNGTTPVAGAFIGVFGSDADNSNLDNNPFFWSPMTDSAGNFRTSPLPAGDYLVSAMHPDYGKVLYESGGNTVISVSADVTGIDVIFRASDQVGTISGTVTNSTNLTLNEVQVLVYLCTDVECTTNAKVKASTSKTTKVGGGAITNGSDVDYSIDKLEPGQYKVRFIGLPEPPNVPSMVWHGGANKASATKETVGAGATVTVNATLLP